MKTQPYALRLKTQLGLLPFCHRLKIAAIIFVVYAPSVLFAKIALFRGSPSRKKLGAGMMLHRSNLLFTKIAVQPAFFAYQISIRMPFSPLRSMIGIRWSGEIGTVR